MKAYVFPYIKGSKSAKTIADELGIKRIKLENSNFKFDPAKIIINWGNTNCPFNSRNVLNPPDAVIRASNKISAARAFAASEIEYPAIALHETNPDDEEVFGTIDYWKRYNQNMPVIARTKISSKGGKGAYYFESVDKIPDDFMIEGERIRMLSKYEKKAKEFRVHVVDGDVIDFAQKKRVKDFDGEVDTKIRSHERGWIFAREDVDIPRQVTAAAVQAVLAVGLDFGAVDVGWNEHYSKAHVYEVNSAPGIEGTTVERYTEALNQLAKKRHAEILEEQNA